MKPNIILASGSPRRKDLLTQIGVEFEVCPAKGEEKIGNESPEEAVKLLASQKAQEVYLSYIGEGKLPQGDTWFIGADTVVAYQNKILGKPKDEEEAFSMLHMIQGKGHQVHTGVCIIEVKATGGVKMETFCETTQVNLYSMTEEDIRDYIRTKEPMDKAGAYGIQGYFAQYIKGISGDYNNVVGLPVGRIGKLLREYQR
ncbi:MAG: septum formation protein Maf [Lachnospiraceae bacterium]|jgi:septum formation protein|nr:septum formation protein Maf [Lachnospiraceae bacterium]